MKAGMAILKPILSETGAKPVGKLVIGTVKGDIHDIGKAADQRIRDRFPIRLAPEDMRAGNGRWQ